MARKKAVAKGRALAGRGRKPARPATRRFAAQRGPMPKLVAQAAVAAASQEPDAGPASLPASDMFRRDRELIHRLIEGVKLL